MAITTSIRMPDEIHDQYETLALATGRMRNDLVVEALRGAADRQLHEIAMIQEGLAQSRAGLGTPNRRRDRAVQGRRHASCRLPA